MLNILVVLSTAKVPKIQNPKEKSALTNVKSKFLVVLTTELFIINPYKNDRDLVNPRENKMFIWSFEPNSIFCGPHTKTPVVFLLNQNNLYNTARKVAPSGKVLAEQGWIYCCYVIP